VEYKKNNPDTLKNAVWKYSNKGITNNAFFLFKYRAERAAPRRHFPRNDLSFTTVALLNFWVFLGQVEWNLYKREATFQKLSSTISEK